MRSFLALILFMCLPIANLYAASNISIIGNERIDQATIESYLPSQLLKGEADSLTIDQSIKDLMATSFFADVSIEQSGSNIKIKVVENPLINKVYFDGNNFLEDDKLEPELSLKPRTIYSKAKAKQDVTTIENIYHRHSRYGITVVPKVVKLDYNRVDVIYEIHEGKKTPVREVNFIGNQVYSDFTLSHVIATRESKWFRFLSNSDFYDPDKIELDKELLRKFYFRHGYAGMRIESVITEYNPKNHGFHISFVINEGAKYNYGNFEIINNIKSLKVKDIIKEDAIKAGELFDIEEVEKLIEKSTNSLADKGYAFASIIPEYQLDDLERKVYIKFVIEESARYYVRRINITGNYRTSDKVIRREILLAENDPFNLAKLRNSERNLRALDFFKNVTLDTAPRSQDQLDLEVQVEEKSTGYFSLAGGYSTTEGALLRFGITENNLLGLGHQLNLSLSKAAKNINTSVSYTNPYFLDYDFSFGFDYVYTDHQKRRYRQYDHKIHSLKLRGGYELATDLLHSPYYQIREDTLGDISDSASFIYKQQAGTRYTSLIGHSFIYNKLDNPAHPTQGYYAIANQEFAGLGGDNHYLKHSLRLGRFQPIIRDDITLETSGGLGYITSTGKSNLALVELYHMGAEYVRGFAYDGIGPRDLSTDDALGGKFIMYGRVEATFPLGLPEELAVRGAVFLDAGNLSSLDNYSALTNYTDKYSLRSAIGFGIKWDSPVGPLVASFGFPISKETFDKTQVFGFAIQTPFN